MRLLPFALVSCVSLGACGFQATSKGDPSSDAPVIEEEADAPTIDAPVADPMLLQQQSQGAATGASLTATLSTTPTSGNMLVMIGAANSGTLATVTGGGVTTWTRAANSASNANVEVWFGVTDGSTGTVAIARATNTQAIWLSVSEWSGLAASSSLDKASAASGTSGPANAGTITTTNARDLLLFAVADENTATFDTPTQGPWSAFGVVSIGAIRQTAWHRIVSATGGYGPQVTSSGNRWDAAVVALRIAP